MVKTRQVTSLQPTVMVTNGKYYFGITLVCQCAEFDEDSETIAEI